MVVVEEVTKHHDACLFEMKKLITPFLFLFALASYGQEVIEPIAGNPDLYGKTAQRLRSGTSIDSTFIYSVANLAITDVWDDFSENKFVNYPPGFADAGVTSIWYWCLMNATNTVPEPSTAIYCDSLKSRHDSVFVISGIGTTFTTMFTPHTVWVNDLDTYPVTGGTETLYDECYVLVDSVIDMVPDPTQDTIWYTSDPTYKQDSAHVFFKNLNDPSKIWMDNSACHNYRYAVDPWSLGVATFDGVDSSGTPYQFNSPNAWGQADVLTSKPVNLNGTSNVFLQFLFQPQGYGNMPEDEDSLIVDFYLVDSAKWYPWWNAAQQAPNPANEWDTAFIPVPANFLDNGFKFRFRNYASLSGALDHWHIDYVQLYENPLLAVQPFKDLAVSYPLTTLLDEYTSVPWDHYRNLATPNDEMDDTTRLYVWNSDVDPTNVGSNIQMEISYDGSVQNTYLLGNPGGPVPNPNGVQDWDANWELGMNGYPIYSQMVHLFFDAPGNDTMATFQVKVNADAAVAASNVYTVNDTTVLMQEFKNYYAYDDGTAEVAYGIQGSNSQLAYEFNAYEADTLAGVGFHFVPTVTDVSGYIMLLTVWADDGNGSPGDILYQDDFFQPHYPTYAGYKNGYVFYDFVNPAYPSTIPVPEKFYVGWEQIDAQSLNVGMDRNTVNNDKIQYNVGGSWITSSQAGSLMIRPVFSTNINHTLSIEEREVEMEELNIVMYPNPAKEMVSFNGLPDDYVVSMYDMSGRLVFSEQQESTVDISFLQNGIYVVDIRDLSGVSLYTEKLIKE